MDFETNYQNDGDRRGIVCDICGSNQFDSHEGFYYCSECNTQSQQTREYIDDTDEQVARAFNAHETVAVLGKKGTKKTKVQRAPKILLTSWEVHNLALKAMADKLISIGFPALLKDKLFQLWKAYLLKREVILCEDDLKPGISVSRISVGEPKTNLMAFYKFKKAIKKKYAPKKKRSVDSQLARKRADNRLKRKAFEATYLASRDDDALPPGVERAKEGTKVGLRKLKLTKAAGKVYRAMKQKRKVKSKLKFLGENNGWALRVLQHEKLTYSRVLILLFIASRQIGCRVVFTDFIRLFDDGTLFVNSLNSLLGCEAASKYYGSANAFLASCSRGISNPVKLASMTQGLLDYLGVYTFQYPKFQEFLPKFVEDSSLPLEFESLLVQLYKMYPEEDHILDLPHEHFPLKLMIEVLITSMMGLLLRMLFGLDDATEKHQSRFASKVNEILSRHLNPEESGDPRAEWTQLFDIKEWFRHIRYRTSFVEQERQTPHLFRPGTPPNLIRLNEITTRYSNSEIKLEPETDSEDAHLAMPAEMSSTEARNYAAAGRLRGIFELATIKAHGGIIPEVSDYVSLPYPYQTMVEEFKHGKPNIAYPNYDSPLLYADFKKKRIDFIFNPDKYIPILEKAGYKVKVLPGTAPQYTREAMKIKKRRLLLFQPYKKLEETVETIPNTKGHIRIPASMQFVVEHLTRYIFVSEKYEGSLRGKPQLLTFIERLTKLYALRSLNGFIPLVP